MPVCSTSESKRETRVIVDLFCSVRCAAATAAVEACYQLQGSEHSAAELVLTTFHCTLRCDDVHSVYKLSSEVQIRSDRRLVMSA